ncbi:lysoplasmalogenase [uncultured Lacinutrix sp.]|uniref:lysoplasmalogenase n=1 Tax=uncultured Lacinutrix sp. TaxID=574032 RepID=UPI00261D0697|nr:lysoplasmalogenase [uncultured Lacinutrix sp.]
MKPNNNYLFFIIFFFLVAIETTVANLDGLTWLHYIFKPLIVISLIIYFTKHNKHLSIYTQKFTFFALTFSLIGDILLLFVNRSQLFFIGGLIAFLIAHILYSLVFFNKRNKNTKWYGFVAIILIYTILLFSYLKTGIGHLLIPVIIYMLVILTMVTSAFLRKGMVNTNSFNLVFIGALIFIASDSLLALNKFYAPLSIANFGIMFTYALAQLLIVLGLLKQQDFKV